MKKLIKKILISGTIETTTGLLIGGSSTAMGIGGPDKTVVRNPINNQPYIPGSSLKGKMRSLLELSMGTFSDTGMKGDVKNGPSKDPSKITSVLFGYIRNNGNEALESKQLPSRLIVRDGQLINGHEFLYKTDLPFTESKVEVMIDRLTSASMPRTIERVPAGAFFSLNLVLNIHENDLYEPNEMLAITFTGLILLQDDFLGGNGSRGSGRVKFHIEKVEERNAEFYHRNDAIPNNVTEICGLPNDLR